MKLSVIGLLALLAAGPAAAIASAQPPATSTTMTAQDQALHTRIHSRINGDAALKKYDIKVNVENGVATLTGTVATDAERTKAGDLAKVAGVTRVENKIVTDLDAATRSKGTTGEIKDKTKAAGEKTKEGAGKVVDKTKEGSKAGYEKTKEGAGKVVDKSKEGLSKTGEVITDGWITSRIKTKFAADGDINASDINVDTNDHVVTLTGTVPSAAAHAKALKEAKEVEGVHRVVDRLRVVPKTK